MSLFRRNNILYGILFGQEALLELREDMMLDISSLSVGCRNIVLRNICHFHLRDKESLKNVYVCNFYAFL